MQGTIWGDGGGGYGAAGAFVRRFVIAWRRIFVKQFADACGGV